MSTLLLACGADARYLPHTAAMLHSAITRTPELRLRVCLMHAGDLPDAELERLDRFLAGLGAELRPLAISPAQLAGFPRRHFHISCWYRVLLPELLPAEPRILYLDSDMIVTGSLAALWQTDVSGHLFGAVSNPLYPFMRNWPREDLGLADPLHYLNSGMMLMNLEAMRRENTLQQLRDFAAVHPDNSCPEQDALSALFHARARWLHPRWNVQSTLFDLKPAQLPFAPATVAEALADAAVIHYIGPYKPWHYLCDHPRRELYFAHRRATPWPLPDLEGRSLGNALIKPLPLAWKARAQDFGRGLRRQLGRLRRTLAGNRT